MPGFSETLESKRFAPGRQVVTREVDGRVRRFTVQIPNGVEGQSLPVVVFPGHRGGIELGFNYRMRLTGLAADEAEAMAIILSRPMPELDALGLRDAVERARGKLIESFPDQVRPRMEQTRRRVRFAGSRRRRADPRIAAIAEAVREARIIRINANSAGERALHPVALVAGPHGWSVVEARHEGRPIPLAACGDINVSARRFRGDS